MRIERFRETLADEIGASGHPGVAKVERYLVPEDKQGLDDLVVRCQDGASIFLRVVATSSPTHKDDREKPEEVIVRAPGAKIVVTRRSTAN